MDNKLLSSLIISVILCAVPNLAFGWGAATHAYLAKELGHEPGVTNLQEMYGAVIPDMFNLMFSYEHQDYLWIVTHYQLMKVVEEAKFDESTAFAYGFASHSEDWGADHTAHISSITVNPDEGYVVKDDYSEELAATLDYVKGQLESHGVESQLPADLE